MIATDSGEAKELKGIYLRSIPGTKAKNGNTDTLKLLADVYSSLGAALGFDGSFAKAGPFDNLKFNATIGMSRSIFSASSGYTPLRGGRWLCERVEYKRPSPLPLWLFACPRISRRGP